MKELPAIVSAPMLIIAVGNFAGALLTSVQPLLHHTDPRLSTMVGFYKVISVSGGEEDLRVSVEQIGKMQAQASSSLEAVLHDLRLHEKFLEAGLGDEHDLALGVIVLADLTEPGSESLYPLMEALSETIAKEPGSFIYLLCKTAIFEVNQTKKSMQARLHLHLNRLKTLSQEAELKLQIYLFDGSKEGLLEAKDEHEIELLIQNFLLALLSGKLAQRLAYAYALADGDDGDALFNSAGTTALIYDPTTVQEVCATQLAVETLDVEFLSDITADPTQIEIAVNGILEYSGNVSSWTEDLCADTPFHAPPAETTSAAVRWIKLDLHFSDLQFEGLPPQEWGDAIVGYAEHFQKELQAIHFEQLQKNAAVLMQAISTSLEVELSLLPARSNLCPGGIANSGRVIQTCVRELSQRIQACLPVQNEEEFFRRVEGKYSSTMESLDQAIGDLPEPPRWVNRLSGKLYTYAKVLFEFLFLRREHAQLVILREKIIRALEDKFIFQFEQRLRKSIAELCDQLISSLESSQSELNALYAKFQNLKDHLQGQATNALPGSSTLPLRGVLRFSPFRIELLTPALFQWAYVRREKDIAEICVELLEGSFLKDWRNVSEEYLHEGLVSVCRRAYQFLNHVNVEDVLKDTEFNDLSTGLFRWSSSLMMLAQGALPALRPDFDSAGESVSYVANYFLCADPRESDIPDILKNSGREWQEIPTGDSYVILFCRVRQMVSVNALSHLLQSAQAAFESLNEREQKELQEAFEGESS